MATVFRLLLWPAGRISRRSFWVGVCLIWSFSLASVAFDGLVEGAPGVPSQAGLVALVVPGATGPAREVNDASAMLALYVEHALAALYWQAQWLLHFLVYDGTLATVVVVLAEQIETTALGTTFFEADGVMDLALGFPLLFLSQWMAFCLVLKRMRDRQRRRRWVLLSALPIIGFIWWVLDLGCGPPRLEAASGMVPPTRQPAAETGGGP